MCSSSVQSPRSSDLEPDQPHELRELALVDHAGAILVHDREDLEQVVPALRLEVLRERRAWEPAWFK